MAHSICELTEHDDLAVGVGAQPTWRQRTRAERTKYNHLLVALLALLLLHLLLLMASLLHAGSCC